jgi:hypothetical protein
MFIRSLLLFDRIVIPIPNNPIHELTLEELDQLRSDAKYLQDHGAATVFEWQPTAFDDYLKDRMKEALAVGTGDLLYESRLLLQKHADELKPDGVMEVTAVPIYGARERFEEAYREINAIEQQQLMVQLGQLISVPEAGAPLEDIIRLRESKQFETARLAFRNWQFKKLPEEIAYEKSAKMVALAVEDYKRMLTDYEGAMSSGRFSKIKGAVTAILALASGTSAMLGHTQTAIAFLSGAAPNIFSLKGFFAPRWKDFKDKSYAPAAVVFSANQTLTDL